MKYPALIIFFIFVLFAFWQLNDPDPVLWVPIYLLAAYLSFRAYQGKFNPELLIACVVMYLAGGINAWLQMTAWEGVISDSLAMKSPNQELAREALGLGICAIATLTFGLASLKK